MRTPETTISWLALCRSRAIVPANVAFRAFAHETILLNVDTGEYHGLDSVGARFFEVLRDAASVEQAMLALAAEYEQPTSRIAGDLTTFCATLRERGLMEFRRDLP